jgi:hypothetical protein
MKSYNKDSGKDSGKDLGRFRKDLGDTILNYTTIAK